MTKKTTTTDMTLTFTSEFARRLIAAVPDEAMRSVQIEEIVRPQIGMLPLLTGYEDAPELTGAKGKARRTYGVRQR